MADSTHNISTMNGHATATAELSTASSTSSSSSGPPVDLLVLVVTPITAIVKELQSRLSTLPAGVRVEVPDTRNSQHLNEQIAHCNVIYGEPKEIHDKLQLARKLQWVQLVMAGIDKALSFLDISQAPFRISRAGGDSFGPHMSEFVLCHILARERHLFEWDIAQKEHRWKTADPNYGYRTLDNLTVAIMGCSGSIGMHIARTCHFFKMNIKGLASKRPTSSSSSHSHPSNHHPHRSHASSHTQPPIEWYYTEPPSSEGGPSTIPADFFHDVDYLINVLPSTAATRDMLTADVLQHCRRSAAGFPRTVFINMGRGDIISEPALLRALLGSGHDTLLASPHSHLPVPGVDAFLSGAILDVFITEPLPSDHVFYTLSPPLLTVSPHVSGMSSAAKTQIVDLFIDNLNRFINHQPLLYEVDKEKGY